MSCPSVLTNVSVHRVAVELALLYPAPIQRPNQTLTRAFTSVAFRAILTKLSGAARADHCHRPIGFLQWRPASRRSSVLLCAVD